MATAAGRATHAPTQAKRPRTRVRWSIGALSYVFAVGRIEPLPVRTT